MRTLLAALPLLLLVGCSEDEEPEARPSAPLVSDLTRDMGCQGFEYDPEVLGVATAGSCDLDGEEVWVYTYDDSAQQTAVQQISRMGGGSWVVGTLWDAQAPTPELAEKIAAATGGTVEE